jgi:hypothetical protein
LETLPRPYWYTAPRYADNDFYTSWSADSRYLYYMSESGETLSLIEADTTTGQTQRVVFETNSTTEDDLYNIMVWSPDLNYIATGVAFPDVTGDVINLSTGESFALSGIVKPWNIHPEPMPENGGYICQSFSNSGYLSAIDESIPALIIFEPDLSIYVTIDEFDVVSPAFLSCPVWGNEDIYFKIDDREEPEAIFYRYSLTDQAFDARFVNVVFGSSFTISPDETQAAWAYYFDVRLVDLESGETQIIEDYPDHNYSHPIWKPSRP